jgi:hypothetical protein
VSSSVGKALNGLLVLKLEALQVGSLKKYLLSIGRNLTTENLKDNLGRISHPLAELCPAAIKSVDLLVWT